MPVIHVTEGLLSWTFSWVDSIEKPKHKTLLCQRGAVGTTQVKSVLTCPTTQMIMQYRKKWGWRCKTTSYQKGMTSNVFRNVKMKLPRLWAVSEKSEKISTLTSIVCPLLMAVAAELEHANSMTLIMNRHVKKEQSSRS